MRDTPPVPSHHQQVIVFPRGQLSAKDKERLTKIGIVAVEADDPSKVVTFIPGVPLVDSNSMLALAIHAIKAHSNNYSTTPSDTFIKLLSDALKARGT